MNEMEIGAAVTRLMDWVDHYLHCELDHEYDHDRPQTARTLLQAAIRQELLQSRASAPTSAEMH